MIVRKTPKEQRFLRKMFKEHSQHQKYVQRFGFSFVGAGVYNEAIWYSITHLKFNNIMDYLLRRVLDQAANVGSSDATVNSTTKFGNTPSNFIYLCKCTFNYEIYNPTNYNMTVYIYDLICKQDTPEEISYGSSQNVNSSCSPECCMQASAQALRNTDTNYGWSVANPVSSTNSDWRTIGMKPTDYYYFNTMWKVKGFKKLILPPQTAHHHVVVFNPKKKISLGGFLYPRKKHESNDKHGVGGITQSTLFGIEGQVATNDQTVDSVDNENVTTLPGKVVIKCVRKVNVFNFELNTSTINQSNNLAQLTKPMIFSDLFQVTPENA